MSLLQKLKDRRDATNKAAEEAGMGGKKWKGQDKLDKTLRLKGKYGEPFKSNIK